MPIGGAPDAVARVPGSMSSFPTGEHGAVRICRSGLCVPCVRVRDCVRVGGCVDAGGRPGDRQGYRWQVVELHTYKCLAHVARAGVNGG